MEKEEGRALQRRVCHSVWRTMQAIGCVIVLAAALACADVTTAWAMDAGAYLVTVAPSYRDPETGSVDDPGNNAAIGQGMTERMCGSTGLLEVETSGEMYLTVRYYLSQFIRDVSFEERIGGNYVSRSYQTMKSRAAVEGSGDIEEKYGYTDYRIPIGSMDSVFRGKAYIEAMGRNVVFFFTVSDARNGSGDFVVSSGTGGPSVESEMSQDTQTEAGQGNTTAQATDLQGDAEGSSGARYALTEEADFDEAVSGMEDQGSEWEEFVESVSGKESVEDDDWINGSGNADDPVTGIPKKSTGQADVNAVQGEHAGFPSGASAAVNTSGVSGADPTEYHLETSYDLSAVPLKEARKLTEPMLEEATGISGIAGELETVETPEADGKTSEWNGNKLVMTVLLGAAALLLVWFAAAGARPGRRSGETELESGSREQTGGEKE
ncbi:MAG: hypothetical protein LUE86_03190 [Clostridiales bacterium]|nr:hypothetical protein [Clostridiales bacterium]